MSAIVLEPDLLVHASGRTERGKVRIERDRVQQVGPDVDVGTAELVPLPGRMLLPGLANAHSHAFQRALRGRVETRSPDAPDDDFWSWRRRMYACALSLDAGAIELVARWAYADMLKAGFTSVGEFHYLHHAPDGKRWAFGPEASARLAAAGEAVGLRIALLQTAYERGGHRTPPSDGQRRFVFPDVGAFLEHAAAVRSEVTGERVTHGLAVHSVRACSRLWIEALAEASAHAALPLHVHACEQLAELRACREEHGMLPLELLDAAGALGGRTTVVHATHIDGADVERLARAGSTVCVCPSTERNLGDGLCPIRDLSSAGVPLAVGTDSHARIDAADELRSLEDHERLRVMRRVVLEGEEPGLAGAVLRAGVEGGARALGLEVPALAPGAPADLVAVQLGPEGQAHAEAAADAWLVGGSSRDVRDVWVAGERVVEAGKLTRLDEEELHREVGELLTALG